MIVHVCGVYVVVHVCGGREECVCVEVFKI